jgi:hypothetical protein
LDVADHRRWPVSALDLKVLEQRRHALLERVPQQAGLRICKAGQHEAEHPLDRRTGLRHEGPAPSAAETPVTTLFETTHKETLHMRRQVLQTARSPRPREFAELDQRGDEARDRRPGVPLGRKPLDILLDLRTEPCGPDSVDSRRPHEVALKCRHDKHHTARRAG